MLKTIRIIFSRSIGDVLNKTEINKKFINMMLGECHKLHDDSLRCALQSVCIVIDRSLV